MYMAVEKMLAENQFSGKAKTNLADLIANFEQWRKTMNAVTPDELAERLHEKQELPPVRLKTQSYSLRLE